MGPLVALVLAAIGTWPLVLSGAGSVQAHPLREGGATASGHVQAWGLWSAGGPSGPFLERRVAAPGGVFIGEGEHGAAWRVLGSQLSELVGTHRAADLLTLGILALSGWLAFRVGRVLRLSRLQSILAALLWVASPALIERGLTSHAGLAPPMLPAAVLLATAIVQLRAPLAAALALGAVGALAAAVGEGTAIATACAALVGAFLARGSMPRVVGGSTVVALGLALAASTTLAAALWVDAERDQARGHGVASAETGTPRSVAGMPGSALPEGIEAAAIDRRPIAGPSPFHPLARLMAAERSAGSGRPAPAIGLAAIGLGALVVLRVPRWRHPAVLALVGLAGAALSRSLMLEAALLPLSILAMAFVAARGLATVRKKSLAMAVCALALLELAAVPWPLARWSSSANLDRLAVSPVRGSVLDLPVRAGPQAAHSRQTVHQRSTPLALYPERSQGSLEALVQRAPAAGHLLLGQVPPDPDQLAAELEWIGVGHLLVEIGSMLPAVVDALDSLPGWERAPDDGVVHWWYRTRGLWTADAAVGESSPDSAH